MVLFVPYIWGMSIDMSHLYPFLHSVDFKESIYYYVIPTENFDHNLKSEDFEHINCREYQDNPYFSILEVKLIKEIKYDTAVDREENKGKNFPMNSIL